jgi:DNA-binding transcriptional LysR family regulator
MRAASDPETSEMNWRAFDLCELPFASPTIPIRMLWHRRFDERPAHVWLRKLVQQTAKNLSHAYPRY